MMEFKTTAYDPNRVKLELDDLDVLLKSKGRLEERKDLQPFFKKREQLTAFMGTYALNIGPATHLAYEFPFLGDFAADIIVGNRAQGEYLVIELEDGASNSVFAKIKGRKTKEWSKRFDHGYSQLIDWFSCLDDYRKTNKFIDEFGHGYVTFYGLLIVSRNTGMTDGDRTRLRWRSKNVVVHSQPVTCITFDDLHAALQQRLTLLYSGDKGRKNVRIPRPQAGFASPDRARGKEVGKGPAVGYPEPRHARSRRGCRRMCRSSAQP